MDCEEAVEVGLAWVAAGWLWAPGQVVLYAKRSARARPTAIVEEVIDGRPYTYKIPGWARDGARYLLNDFVPDLRDPGTRGHAREQMLKSLGLDDWKLSAYSPKTLRVVLGLGCLEEQGHRAERGQ